LQIPIILIRKPEKNHWQDASTDGTSYRQKLIVFEKQKPKRRKKKH
jgi:hypothetical protein